MIIKKNKTQNTSQAEKKRFSLVLTKSQVEDLNKVINSDNTADIIYLEVLSNKRKQLTFRSFVEIERIKQEQEVRERIKQEQEVLK